MRHPNRLKDNAHEPSMLVVMMEEEVVVVVVVVMTRGHTLATAVISVAGGGVTRRVRVRVCVRVLAVGFGKTTTLLLQLQLLLFQSAQFPLFRRRQSRCTGRGCRCCLIGCDDQRRRRRWWRRRW